MSWNKLIKKYGNYGRGYSGLYKHNCGRWIQRLFRQNWEKRKEYWGKYKTDKLTEQDFEDLLEMADGNAPKEELENYKQKFYSREFSDMDMDYILKHSIPDMFYFKDMIRDVGGDPKLKEDYDRAMQFMIKERKLTEKVLSFFWNSDEYYEMRNNGHTEAEIWQEFMEATVSRGRYPLYCDPYDGRYKLLDLNAYVYILSRRTRSITSEALNKAQEFQKISVMFPSVQELLPAMNGEVEKIKPWETLKLNPPHYLCPLCNQVFEDETLLTEHLIDKHRAQK